MPWYDIFGFERQKRRRGAHRRRSVRRKVAKVVVVPTRQVVPLIDTSSGSVFQLRRPPRR